MTAALMHLLTRRQLCNLNPTTQAEFRAWINNKLTPILGRADMITMRTTGNLLDDMKAAQDDAIEIAKAVRNFEKELDELFAERPAESTGHEGRD